MDDLACLYTWALAVYFIRVCMRRWDKKPPSWWEQRFLGLRPVEALG